jgi:hypothetical protein
VQSKPPPSTGALIGGLAIGLALGGTVAWVIVLIVGAFLSQVISPNSNVLPFIFAYVVALALGSLAIIVRKQGSLIMGLFIGLSVGMLGGTALCNLVIVGLGNTH